MAKRARGRPMLYDKILYALPENDLFSPATIANFAVEHDFIEGERELRNKVRASMVRFCNNHQFPNNGDGMVTMKGNAPTPAWFGWRWREAIGVRLAKGS